METKKNTLNYMEVRECIESVPEPKTKIFLKALYLLGIPRPTELTSKRDPSSGNMNVTHCQRGRFVA